MALGCEGTAGKAVEVAVVVFFCLALLPLAPLALLPPPPPSVPPACCLPAIRIARLLIHGDLRGAHGAAMRARLYAARRERAMERVEPSSWRCPGGMDELEDGKLGGSSWLTMGDACFG